MAQPLTEKELQLFRDRFYPVDSYTQDGKYWADLPLSQRVPFVQKADWAEVKREFAVVTWMTTTKPWALISWYYQNSILPGAGLLLESYVLFSIGNLQSLFANVWPLCWQSHETCNKDWIAAVVYLEILGIMCGQLAVGVGFILSLPCAIFSVKGDQRG